MSRRNYLLAIFTFGFALRAIAAFLLYFYFIYDHGDEFLFGSSGDDYRYHQSGIEIARGDFTSLLTWRYAGYNLFCGGIYFLFGDYTLMVRLVNGLFGSLIALNVYRITSRLYHESIARKAGILCCLFPSLIFWNALQYKDTLLLYFCTLLLWIAIRLRVSANVPKVLGFVGCLIALSLVRIETSITFGFLSLVYILCRSWKRFTLRHAFSILFLIILTVILSSTAILWGYNADILGASRLLEFKERRLESLTSNPETVPAVGIIYSFPLNIIGTLYLPLPSFVDMGSEWEITDKLLVSGTTIWIMILPFAFMGIYYSLRNHGVVCSIIPATFLTTVIGILIHGYIMIYRHKVQMYAMILILAAVGIREWPQKSRDRFMTYYYIQSFIVILVYNVLRKSIH